MKPYVLRPVEGASFRINYDADLNPQQREVVLAPDGASLVIAGAGSGKTRTLTYRVARLVESGVPAASILLVTFTNKAAREMLRRVEALAGADMRGLTGGTFHHVANLFLRKYAAQAGYTPNFTILDRDDSADLMDDLSAKNAALRSIKKPPKGDVLIEIHSYARNTGVEASRVIAERHPHLLELTDELNRIFRRYDERKHELNVMDFDDLLLHWRSVLRNDASVLEAARARYRYVLVDEYQDTNRLQADIVERIAGERGNLMVVGDDAQSIYSFRGADFGNIIGFPDRFPGCRVFKLETNYRSRPEILAVANSCIRHNQRQFRKTLNATRGSGPKPERINCGDPNEQAHFVAQRIEELGGEGTDYSEIAILYRAHWHSMELQLELTRRGIPFQVRSGLRFFEQAHIKDIVGYLKVVANRRDELAWKRILKLYPRIGRATADRITTALLNVPDPLASLNSEPVLTAVPGAARPGWKELVSVLSGLQEPALRAAPAEMIRTVLDGGYENYLATAFPNANARIEDVRRFADYSLRFRELDELLSELSLDTSPTGTQVENDEEGEGVVLSTVHQAKGLEWGSVFVIWLAEGKFPDIRSLRETGGEEEERRLFYVAITRAKDNLFLVSPLISDERGMQDVIQKPSRFLTELDLSTYDEFRAGW